MSGVRIADVPDVKHIMEIGLELLENSVYNGIKPDRQKFQLLVAGLMGSKHGIVYVVVDDDDIPQGFMLGMVEEHFFSRERYGSDLGMYVRKPYRAYAPTMIKKFVAWALSKPRVKSILFGISSGMDELNRTGKLYEKLGFDQVGGMYYMRVLP